LRIDRHDRLREAGDGNAFDGFAVLQLRDDGPDRSTGRLPKEARFEIGPTRPWVRLRGGFRPLGDDGSRVIEGETFEVSGSHIESKNQVMVWHRRFDKVGIVEMAFRPGLLGRDPGPLKNQLGATMISTLAWLRA
jgi:hypothetical protein